MDHDLEIIIPILDSWKHWKSQFPIFYYPGNTPVVQYKKTLVKKMSPWPGENDSPPNCFKIRK